MFAAARVVGLCALAALATGAARAEDDPVYEGKKTSQWASVAQDEKATVRQRALAVEALGKLWILEPKTKAIEYVAIVLRTDKSAAVRSQAAIVLGSLRAKDMETYGAKPLIEVLKTEPESRVRKEIIAGMAKYPAVCAAGVESLAVALKDTDPVVRVAGAEALALAGPTGKSAAPDLVPLLKDMEKPVRIAAVYALGRIAPEGAGTIAETMAALLSTEKDLDIRRELLASIGLLAEKSGVVIRALTVALTDKEDDIRRAAVRALGVFGTASAPAADDLLKMAMTDATKDIRVDAVRAFGSALGPTGVKARLKEFRALLDPVKEPDYEVRLALIDEIAALGYEHLGIDLTSTDEAAKTLAKETISVLRLRLADPQVLVRKAAGSAIEKIEKKPEPKKDPKKDPEPKKEP